MSKRVSGQGDSRSMPASAAIQAVLLLCACGEADRPGEAPIAAYLTPSLAPDTMITFPSGAIDLFPLGPDLLVRTFAGYPDGGRSGHPPLLHRMAPPESVWSSYDLPFSLSERPYWSSFAPFPVAVSGDSVFVMSGLRYPITIITGMGRSLILTRAGHNPERMLPPFEIAHTSLEVYDRHSGVKLYEDVPLPDGSRVLGGGRFLYLLLDAHSPPWRIAKLRLLTER